MQYFLKNIKNLYILYKTFFKFIQILLSQILSNPRLNFFKFILDNFFKKFNFFKKYQEFWLGEVHQFK